MGDGEFVEDLKLKIGKCIRKIREQQGLTREQFCKEGVVITEKQLMRIELGQCMPTIPKLQAISDRLGNSLSELFGQVQVPREYYNLKYQLIKDRTFCEKYLIDRKRELINYIYDMYYDTLPDSDLLTLDIIDRILDYIEDSGFPIEEVFKEEFESILFKEKLLFNDLLLINFYFIQCYYSDYDTNKFKKYCDILMNQDLFEDELSNIQFVYTLVEIIYLYDKEFKYKDMIMIIEKVERIIDATNFFEIKPIILVLEGNYYLFANNDKKRASKKYEHALVLLEEFGDVILINNSHIGRAFKKALDLLN